jgi:hypothetical protein
MTPPSDIITFISRWRRKSLNYNLERLQGCFDAFFSAFVLYNFLYDYICQEDAHRFPEEGDRKRAVEVARRFLSSSAIAEDEVVKRSAQELVDLVNEKSFYIRDDEWDAAQVAGLGTANAERWTEALMEVLYRIRCNTFHGRKLFHESQKRVLMPCITILRRVNDLLIEKLAPGRVQLGEPKRRPDLAESEDD